MEYIIPAVVILVGNLFSGPPGSRSWEFITALFGWATLVSLASWFVLSSTPLTDWGNRFLLPTFGFCMLQALTRDYQRILQPIVDGFRRNRRGKSADDC